MSKQYWACKDCGCTEYIYTTRSNPHDDAKSGFYKLIYGSSRHTFRRRCWDCKKDFDPVRQTWPS